jgi:hypothetical protein
MARLVVRRDRRSREDVASRLLGMVVNITSNLVPDVLDELPLVDQSRMSPREKEGWLELAGLAGGDVTVEADRAPCRPERRLRLPTAAWSLDQDGSGRSESGGELRIREARKVVLDPPGRCRFIIRYHR